MPQTRFRTIQARPKDLPALPRHSPMLDVRRREFVTLLGGAAAMWPLAARAEQPAKIARIGFMRGAGPNEKEFNAFRSGLHAHGYIEGQNIVIEQRYAAGAYDRLDELAAQLVRLEMDVIAVDGTPAAKAAKAATASVPVVFTLVADPVADGLATSMSRPGANLTGLTQSVGFQLTGKRVELLKDIKPNLTRLAVLKNPNHAVSSAYLSEAEKAAAVLRLTVRTFDARSPDDLPATFAAMVEWRADGVITINDGMLYSQRERIVMLARESRLASMHPETGFVEAGGLVSYGPSLPHLFLRAATYIDKILKGAKPADLPIEQPTKFELVVNLKTAKVLGLLLTGNFCCAPTR
jgi:putative ABC transport system substrate-binding protein